MSYISAIPYGITTPETRRGHSSAEMVIYTADSPAGGGKTYAMIREAVRLASLGCRIVIAQPSLVLIEQTLANLRVLKGKRPFPITAIHSGTSGNVARDLVEHLRNADPEAGQILLITHAALFDCPYWHGKDSWTLIVDEIPQVTWETEISVPHTHPLISEAITVEPYDILRGLVVPKDWSRLTSYAENQGDDDVYAVFQAASKRILSDNWRVTVQEAQYRALLDGKDRASGRLGLCGLLGPQSLDGFEQLIIMGANFRSSLLAQLWSRHNVRFRPYAPIQDHLRYQTHPGGDRVTLYYVSETPWSKTLRDKAVRRDGQDVTVLDDVVERCNALFGDEEFLFMANKDVGDDVFHRTDAHGVRVANAGAHRLPNSPHGLNNYQHIHNVVVLSALNPRPASFTSLEADGVDSDEVRTALSREPTYQAAARTSLRDPTSTHPVRVVVGDRDTAEWAATVIPGAHVRPLLGIENMPQHRRAGRPRIHAGDEARKAADAARKATARSEKKSRLTDHLRVLNNVLSSYEDNDAHKARIWDDMRKGLETPLAPGDIPAFCCPEGHSWQDLAGTGLRDIYAPPVAWMIYEGAEKFIQELRSTWERTIPYKEAAGMFAPAIFDPNVPYAPNVKPDDRVKKGTSNVLAIRGVWLDFDDGCEFSHAEFAKLFPRYRIAAFNTYSSKVDAPRWRAFIPTSGLMSVEVHKLIVAQMLQVLNRNGWWSKDDLEKKSPKIARHHGLDMGKTIAASLFYLPSQAGEVEASFFVDYNDNDRRPIDLFNMVDRTVVHERPEPVYERPEIAAPTMQVTEGTSAGMRALREKLFAIEVTEVRDRSREIVVKAVDDWRGQGCQPGQGNAGFYKFAMTLARSEMTDVDIEQTLYSEAQSANSPGERRKQVRGLMKAVRKARSTRR